MGIWSMRLRLIVFLISSSMVSSSSSKDTVCIVGSGIGGSSLAHFLRLYSNSNQSFEIHVFERNDVVGGRVATVHVSGEGFEAGASILHPKNLYALSYTKLLNLTINQPSSSSSCFGIWDGQSFLLKTICIKSDIPFLQYIISSANSLILFLRYGFSLLRMDSFVQSAVDKFIKYYTRHESRPIFESVEEMLHWAGLYNLTTCNLGIQLAHARLSPLLIQQLVTVITRINYGQSTDMSGLAGAVSLAGSVGGLWSIKGGNSQMASGLLNHSNVSLHLNEEIQSISHLQTHYQLHSTKGNTYKCQVAVIATPLDEVKIQFTPPISIPHRTLQHTHATFVRGLLNPEYFGLKAVSEIPDLVGTIELPDLPFTSISVLKQHDEKDMTYKIFSRKAMNDSLLDSIFSFRKETVRIDWGAYPHYHAPEVFAPFILDGRHLYYINAFENAASTMETSAVAAENMARLILSRFFGQTPFSSSDLESFTGTGALRVDL